MTHISDFGLIKEVPGMEHKVHSNAGVKGGFDLVDAEGVIPAAIKEIGNKVAARVGKGQLGDISRIPAPAYVHHYFSHCGLVKNDMT